MERVLDRIKDRDMSNKIYKIIMMMILAFVSISVSSTELRKVTIELKWLHQFQFAGIYAAKEQGFYKDAGLDVTIIERNKKSSPLKDVMAGKVQFGIIDASIVREKMMGTSVVMLAAIYQHSPLALIALEKSGIVSPLELINKRVMYQRGVDDGMITEMFNEFGIKENQFEYVPQSFKVDALLTGDADAMSVYLGNQPFYYQQKGIKINIIKPASYGIDLYGDILFTSEQWFKNNKDLALKFRSATIKGWEYALNHKDELIDLIIKKYSPNKSKAALRYESANVEKMISPHHIDIGHISKRRLNHIAQIYTKHHKIINPSPLEGLVYSDHLSSNGDQVFYFALIILAIIILSSVAYVYASKRLYRKIDTLDESIMKKSFKLNDYQAIIQDHLMSIKVDLKGEIYFSSPKIGQLLGYSIDELNKMNISQLYNVKNKLAKIEAITNNVLEKGVWHGEVVLKDKKDQDKHFESIIDELCNRQGKAIGYLIILFDVSDKKEAKRLSITDSLTRLYNRSKIDEVLSYEVKSCKRAESVTSIIFLDIDFFKKINDKHGHIMGDKILYELSQSLLGLIRECDTVGRWGGEEFLIICPNTDNSGAVLLAEKIRSHIESLRVSGISFTISLGVATYERGDHLLSLFKRADDALYKAKNSGRNCVISG